MRKTAAIILIFISPFLLSAQTGAVTNAPGESDTLKKAAQTPPDYPLAPEKYRRPAGFKPHLYKYSLKQMSDLFSADMIKTAREHTARVRAVNAAGKWKPTEKSLDEHECPEWFKDAKFGIFIDWGLWSLASWCPPKKDGAMYPDWYELRMYSNFDNKSPFWGYRNYHIKNWGEDFQRDHFIPLFKARDFEPETLAELFKTCGAKYVVPFSKHHSGFCLWPSSYTHRDVMDMGPKRDIMSPLAEACRKRGMKFGFYFSLSEWEYPLLKDGGQLANFSWNKEIPFSKDMEYKASGKIAVKDFVNEYIIPQAAEFIEKYSPDILWFDADWADKASALGGYDIAAYFYNVSKKPVAVNDRYGLGEPEEIEGKFTAARPRQWLRTVRGDFYTDEYGDTSECIDIENYHPWEACRGISQSYGNNWQDDESNVISAKEFVSMFADIVARGGNLLLLINLDGQGSVPEIQMKRLTEIGSWLKLNGEAIYATRPLSPFTKGGVSYTQSKDARAYYAIISNPARKVRLEMPAAGSFQISAVATKTPLKWEKLENPGNAIEVELPDPLANSELPVAVKVKTN